VILYLGDYDPSGLHMSAVDLPRRLAFHAMLGRYAVTRGEARAWSDEEAASYLEHGGIVFRRLAFVVEDTRTLGRRVSFPASEKGQDARCVWFVLGTGRDESEHGRASKRPSRRRSSRRPGPATSPPRRLSVSQSR
jgi:hypothetical protein